MPRVGQANILIGLVEGIISKSFTSFTSFHTHRFKRRHLQLVFHILFYPFLSCLHIYKHITLVHFSYSQLLSPFTFPIYEELTRRYLQLVFHILYFLSVSLPHSSLFVMFTYIQGIYCICFHMSMLSLLVIFPVHQPPLSMATNYLSFITMATSTARARIQQMP